MSGRFLIRIFKLKVRLGYTTPGLYPTSPLEFKPNHPLALSLSLVLANLSLSPAMFSCRLANKGFTKGTLALTSSAVTFTPKESREDSVWSKTVEFELELVRKLGWSTVARKCTLHCYLKESPAGLKPVGGEASKEDKDEFTYFAFSGLSVKDRETVEARLVCTYSYTLCFILRLGKPFSIFHNCLLQIGGQGVEVGRRRPRLCRSQLW